MSERNFIIVGGGIGGLAAALCLAADGHGVTVLEQSAEFVEAGAGIQLSPNASRVLIRHGLLDALEAVGYRPLAAEMLDWKRGTVIARNELGDEADTRFGAPYFHLHRGDLLAVLVRACRAKPGIELKLGCRVDGIEDDGTQVTAVGDFGRLSADGLIGADGIRSRVSARLYPDEPPPQFTGNVAWRALVPTDRLPAGLVRPRATIWWGPGRHFVHYYVRGGSHVNCVCIVERDDWSDDAWTRRGDHAELAADFAGWNERLTTLIDAMDHDGCYRWALFDRPPTTRWGRGRVALLGDACHPTLPFLAQGAAMAIEDAAILARAVAEEAALDEAFRRYTRTRQPRTAGVQRASRRNARVFHLSGPAALARNLGAGAAGARSMSRLYSYDPLTAALA